MKILIKLKKYFLPAVYAFAVLSGCIQDVINLQGHRTVDYYNDALGICLNYVITDGRNTYTSLFDKINSEGQILLNNTGGNNNSIQCAPAASREMAVPLDIPARLDYFIPHKYIESNNPFIPFNTVSNIFRPPELSLSSQLSI